MPKVFIANPTQEPFLLSDARFLGFFGGIGSGKTAAGAIKAIQKLRDGDGIIVGPDYPHFCKSTWVEVAKWLPWSRVTNRNLQHPHTSEKVLKIQTAQGERRIYYGGMDDAAAWAGPSVNFVWADEFRRKPTRQHFDVLAGRIRVGHNPQLWLTTTPKATLRGQQHWLHEVFVQKKFDPEVLKAFAGANQKLVEYFTAPTSENAEHLDSLYLASLKGLYSGKYADQELGGEFIDFEGLVFANFDEDNGNVSVAADYTPGVAVEWGVDNGFTEGHPMVILMAQVIPPFVNIFAEYVAVREQQEVCIAKALQMGYPLPAVARVDSSAPDLIQRLWDRGIETAQGSHDVDAGISHLRSFIRDGKDQVHIRFHPRCTFSIAEIQAYSYPDAVESGISISSDKAARPMKESDNAADALRYLVWPKQLATLEASAARGDVIRIQTGRPSTQGQQQQVPARGSVPSLTPVTLQEQGRPAATGTQPDPTPTEPLRAPVERRTGWSIFGGPRKPKPQRIKRDASRLPPGW